MAKKTKKSSKKEGIVFTAGAYLLIKKNLKGLLKKVRANPDKETYYSQSLAGYKTSYNTAATDNAIDKMIDQIDKEALEKKTKSQNKVA